MVMGFLMKAEGGGLWLCNKPLVEVVRRQM